MAKKKLFRKKILWNRACANKILVLLSILCLILFIITVVLGVMLHNKTPQKMHKLDSTNFRFASRTKQSERLPRDVLPINYNLVLWPHMPTQTFNGSVTIEVEVLQDTNKIVLHASKQLNISTVTVTKQGTVIAKLYNVTPDDGELVTFQLPDVITPDYYEVAVNYFGNLNTISVGLFTTNLTDGKTMVASLFEPTYARQAFPCFDEPDLKATYDITLVKPSSYIALSNMNEYSRSHDEATDTDAVTFERSVSMSTYLLAFVVCDFDYKETIINTNGIGSDFFLRSYAQKEYVDMLNFAQNTGKRTLEFYIDYFKLPFPLPKLDLIGVPNYVASGLECWGLILFNEKVLLLDEAMEGSLNKVLKASLIAHELAHMWFGNLVTMKWWDDLWLNEGFATFMQYTCVTYIEPSWNMMDMFLPDVLHLALVRDSQKCSHPIVQDVQPRDNIISKFDVITYKKGASVLRMLAGFIGKEKFRQGVSEYLIKFKFKSAVTQDLLNSLEPYFVMGNVGLNLTYILGTWTQQAGYPVLQVKPADEPYTYIVTQSRFILDRENVHNSDCQFHDNSTQSRFLVDPENVHNSDCQFGLRWFIPITYTTNRGPNQSIIWFSDTVDSMKITLNEGDEWFKLNNNQVGFYRVNYGVETWNRLIEELRSMSKVLSISDRAHLINDVFALASARQVSYNVALDLLTYLPAEHDYVPWQAAQTVIQDLDMRLKQSTVHTEFQKFIQHLVKPWYSYIQSKWKSANFTVSDSQFHNKILALSTQFSVPAAISKVRMIFHDWLNSYGTNNVVQIDPEISTYVFKFGSQSVTEEEWDKLWQIYIGNPNPQINELVLQALMSSTNTELLRKLLNLAWDEKYVPGHKLMNCIAYISDNAAGTALIWDYVRANWQKLVQRFMPVFLPINMLIHGVITACNTEVKLKEMEDFFAELPPEVGETGMKSALESCRTNIKWSKDNAATVTQWLTDYLKLL